MKEGRSIFKQTSFICKSNHLTRIWCWSDLESIACDIKGCRLKSYRLSLYISQDAQSFKPPVVAYNPKTKEYRTLASDKSRIPRGFERCELRTSKEVRDVCKHLDKVAINEHDARTIREQMGAANYDDPYRDYKPQTEQGARLMEYAEQQSKNAYTPRFAPGNFIEAFEYDSSNIDRD